MKIFKIIVLIWVLNWVWFSLRPFISDKNLIPTYGNLIQADGEAKRAIVFGQKFYKFLTFSKRTIPQGSTYRVVGLKADSVELVRLVYHLYPCLESQEPNFILVYESPDFAKENWKLYSRLDQESFILKRKRKQ